GLVFINPNSRSEGTSMIPPDGQSSIQEQGPPVNTRDDVVDAGVGMRESASRGSHWRASPGAGPDQNAEIVRQLVEFMANINEAGDYYSAVGAPAPIEGVPKAPQSSGTEGSIDGNSERLGYPLSMCVQGDEYYFQLSEDDLRKVFGRYGEVRLIEVTSPDRDVAHVYYEKLTDAQNAVQDLNDKVLKGVKGVLRVVWGLYNSPSAFASLNSLSVTEQPPVDDEGRDGNERMSLSSSLTESGGGAEAFAYEKNPEGLNDAAIGSCYDDATLNRLLSELRSGSCPLRDDGMTKELRTESTATTSAMSSRRPSQDGIIGVPSSQEAAAIDDDRHGHDHGQQQQQQQPALAAEGRKKGETSEQREYEASGGPPPPREAPQVVSSLPRSTPSAATSPTRGPIRKFTCRFDIGIENDKEFQ
ncbi:hypothetical protein FOZ61_001795, partial [Perkinsus olseni]